MARLTSRGYGSLWGVPEPTEQGCLSPAAPSPAMAFGRRGLSPCTIGLSRGEGQLLNQCLLGPAARTGQTPALPGVYTSRTNRQQSAGTLLNAGGV